MIAVALLAPVVPAAVPAPRVAAAAAREARISEAALVTADIGPVGAADWMALAAAAAACPTCACGIALAPTTVAAKTAVNNKPFMFFNVIYRPFIVRQATFVDYEILPSLRLGGKRVAVLLRNRLTD